MLITFDTINVVIIVILMMWIPFALLDLLIYVENYTKNRVLQLLSVDYSKSLRSLDFTMSNPELIEGKQLFRAIYNTLMFSEDFIEFGVNKIIILSCTLMDNKNYNLHANTLINNETSFEDYYSTIESSLSNYYNLEHGYNFENIARFIVKVWNVDDKRNLKIKHSLNGNITYTAIGDNILPHPLGKIVSPTNIFSNTAMLCTAGSVISNNKFGIRTYITSAVNRHWSKGKITPLSLYNIKGNLKQQFVKPIFTMDIETMKINNVQIPVAISSSGEVNGLLENKIFIIDSTLLKSNIEQALKQLWNQYFKYLENVLQKDVTLNKLTIFAHNLGSFDGYFLYKALMKEYNPMHVSSIIDESNTFISIKIDSHLIAEWKDSLRIFPTSLNKLCYMFGVDGKLIPYNPKFQSLDLFNNAKLFNTFKKYSLQDALSLFKALTIAQFNYFDKFKVDIESIYSTATLSLKIFRTRFLDKPIFILPSNIDLFIRESYFGGGTDVYKAYAKKVFYYDVNSLYPFSMLKPMPYEILNNGKLINLANRSLDSFFGFAKVKITCPSNMLRPVWPFHHEGKTIYPVGTWTGTYFSEELKAVKKLGYEITLINGYEFSKADLFSGYVNTFYDIKKHSVGVERDMAKLQLNNLYGYFGRKQTNIITENIKNDKLSLYLLTRVIKSITPINDEYSTICSYSNINYNMLNKLNNVLHTEVKTYFPFNLDNIYYTGVFPALKYWKDITNKEWSVMKINYGKRMWSFQEEAIKYCKLDCEALHQVLSTYNEIIFKKFKINIHKSLTGPALTMRIFKTHFLKSNSIYQLLGKVEYDIRQSYTGGAVDVYIPHNVNGKYNVISKDNKGKYKVLYYYDVNSLYPYVMANMSMPIGKPIVFDGNIRAIDQEAYGFFYCKITSPEYLEHPILQRKIKTNQGMRTIAALGSWEGWISSLEMDNAVKSGYTFEILKGYQFEKGDIFKEYIETLYQLRQDYSKDHPMNYIAKLLMNSLYGKFGMKMEHKEIQVFNCSDPINQDHFNKVFELWAESITDCVTIGNYKILIRNSLLEFKYNEKEDMFHGLDINIAIASTITAGARVHMSYFKNNPNFRLYYSDTDSIVIDHELPADLVGKKLGQVKLEHIIRKAVFLAPKVYGIEDTDGKTTIKIKGVTSCPRQASENITIDSLQQLLIEESSIELK